MLFKQIIKDYIRQKSKLLGELNEDVQILDHFYAKTLEAQNNLNFEKVLLSTQIAHRILQHVDLHYDKTYLVERDWQFKKIKNEKAQISLYIDETIAYSKLQLRSLSCNQKHCFTLVVKEEKWLIESHVYEDDFKCIFEEYKKVDINKLYTKIRDDYLAKVKETLEDESDIPYTNAASLQKDKNLDTSRVIDKIGLYNREKAVAYAEKYALIPHSPPWGNYEAIGGDCTNFTSQCLYAGGIPFDEQGAYEIQKWYWYSDRRRVPTWTSANAFKEYMLINKKGGLKAKLETFDKMLLGDIVQLGDLKRTRHSMIIVAYIQDDKGNNVDLIIAQHSTSEIGRGYNIPLSTKPIDRLYWHIEGYYK